MRFRGEAASQPGQGASPVPTLRRLGRPARRIVEVLLAGTLALNNYEEAALNFR